MFTQDTERLEAALASASTAATVAEARALAQRARDVARTAPVAARAGACRALLAAYAELYRSGNVDEAAAQLLTAETLCHDLEPPLVAAVQLRAIELALLHQDFATALDGLATMLEFTRRHGLPVEEARAWKCYGMAMQGAGLHDHADRLLARALDIIGTLDHPREIANIWALRIQLKVHPDAASLAAARLACDNALRFGILSGQRFADAMTGTALCNRAALELINGDAAAATECLDRASALTNLSTRPQWLIDVLRAMVGVHEHNTRERRAALERLLFAPDGPPRLYVVESFSVVAALFARLGDPVHATEALTHLALERAAGFASLIHSGASAAEVWHDAAPGAAVGSGSLLERMAVMAELRDDTTGKHCFRVGRLAALLAERAGLAAEEVTAMNLAARLHDLGKVAIPDQILLKPGRLDPAEVRLMQRHTSIGADLLRDDPTPVREAARRIARHHHERWDGTGYPDGLAGEAIPLAARVTALADVFDALTHPRPYKEAWPRVRALEYIAGEAGAQFDPWLTELFLALMRDSEGEWDAFYRRLEADATQSTYLQAQSRLAELETG